MGHAVRCAGLITCEDCEQNWARVGGAPRCDESDCPRATAPVPFPWTRYALRAWAECALFHCPPRVGGVEDQNPKLREAFAVIAEQKARAERAAAGRRDREELALHDEMLRRLPSGNPSGRRNRRGR